MCGISGLLSWDGNVDCDRVKDMVNRQHHRGPDHEAVWHSPSGRCCLGHNRLSIIDLTPAGNQPMLDPETGNVIVYNGEVYNFQELRAECEKSGIHFSSQTDTEVILALYRLFGEGCVERLRGMFAFAIWDEKRASLLLARDRLGEKPLVYACLSRGLAFASEIGALITHPAIDCAVDTEALELFLTLQYVPAPWTIYQGVRKLPPGHYAVIDAKGFRQERYWELDFRDKVDWKPEQCLDALEDKIRESIRIRLVSDVPLGATLSGGVDSSLIVALMSGMTDEGVQTFTVGFDHDAFDERGYARSVAQLYGTDHTEVVLNPQIEELLEQMVNHYGEPYGDKGAVPAFSVSRVAREKVTVILDGDGGDELLGGYPRYGIPEWRMRLTPKLDRWRNPGKYVSLMSRLLEARSFPRRVLNRILVRYLHPELQCLGPASFQFWEGRLRRALMAGASSDVVERWRQKLLEEAMAHADHPIDRMLWLDTHTYLPDDGFVKMDIASMHCSLEARAPLVDHELMELCARFPANIKVRRKEGKHLLKALARRHVPSKIVDRSKRGFAIPVSDWLLGPLSKYLADHILSPELIYPLDAAAVRMVHDKFKQGDHSHAHRLWLLLIYTVWRKQILSKTRRDSIEKEELNRIQTREYPPMAVG